MDELLVRDRDEGRHARCQETSVDTVNNHDINELIGTEGRIRQVLGAGRGRRDAPPNTRPRQVQVITHSTCDDGVAGNATCERCR